MFVADQIPSELRRVVEFLNGQMERTEVIAIEVKQYVGDEGPRTLVPRVIGQTAEASAKRVRGEGRKWDETSFFEELASKRGPAETAVARTLFDWAKEQLPRNAYGNGKVDGSWSPVLDYHGSSYFPIVVYTYGRLEVQFQWLNAPPFDQLDQRRMLMERLNRIPGVAIAADALTRRPSIQLALLAENPEALTLLIDSLNWFCREVKERRAPDQGDDQQ